jgi:hypothetical protein
MQTGRTHQFPSSDVECRQATLHATTTAHTSDFFLSLMKHIPIQAALRKIKKSKADQTKWRKFKSKLKVLKAKGLRNSRLLLGLRAPQEDTVRQGEVPEVRDCSSMRSLHACMCTRTWWWWWWWWW